MSAITCLHEQLILPELAATTKKEALSELARAVQAAHPDIDADRLYATLLEREKLGSTGIGDSIALPHGKLKGLTEIIICFGRSPRGIPFDAQDNKPVHLFFLLLAPEESAAAYLSCLAELSRFLKNPTVRQNLIQAGDKEELAEIFKAI